MPQVPRNILAQRRGWWNAYKIWVSIRWVLTLLATVFASLAAAFSQYASFFGVVAAGASALLGASHPGRRAGGFMRAYRRLNNACIAFENDRLTIDELLKVHSEAEMFIEGSEKEED